MHGQLLCNARMKKASKETDVPVQHGQQVRLDALGHAVQRIGHIITGCFDV